MNEGAWNYRVRPCLNGLPGWIAFAKRGPFTSDVAHEILEPGRLWFEFGETERAAREAIQKETGNLCH